MEEPAFILGMMFGALALFAAQTWLRSWRVRRRQGAARSGRIDQSGRIDAAPADEARRLREIEELHQRLAVLERIATDPAQRTAAEIERLR